MSIQDEYKEMLKKYEPSNGSGGRFLSYLKISPNETIKSVLVGIKWKAKPTQYAVSNNWANADDIYIRLFLKYQNNYYKYDIKSDGAKYYFINTLRKKVKNDNNILGYVVSLFKTNKRYIEFSIEDYKEGKKEVEIFNNNVDINTEKYKNDEEVQFDVF